MILSTNYEIASNDETYLERMVDFLGRLVDVSISSVYLVRNIDEEGNIFQNYFFAEQT